MAMAPVKYYVPGTAFHPPEAPFYLLGTSSVFASKERNKCQLNQATIHAPTHPTYHKETVYRVVYKQTMVLFAVVAAQV